MKFSLRFNNDHPVSSYVRWAKLAESVGFNQFWVSNDLFFRSAPVILTAVALATEKIEIGTCILNPYSINPAEIAMMIATLDEVSNGRFNLGLSSGAEDFLNWIGVPYIKPRTAVIESTHAINQLLSGNRAAVEGEFLKWSGETYLRFTPRRRVPIYIGAMSPKMLEEIGRIADGGLPLLFPPEHYQNVIPLIEKGAREANRNIDQIDVAACIWCSVSEDKAAAEDALKEKVAYYGHALSESILQQIGLTHADFEAIEHAVMVENDIEKAKQLVTPPMLQIGIAGKTDDLIRRVEKLTNLEAIGRDVIPHFS